MLLGAWVAVACAPRVRPVEPEPPLWIGAAAGPCSATFERVAAVDEPTDLGFSAIEAMQRLGGRRTSPLVWLDPPRTNEYELEFGPERQASELSVSLALAPGDIGLRRTAATSEESGDVDCGPDALLIPVEVVLQSAGHALDESFRGVLEASSPHRGRLTARFERGALAGGLVFSRIESLDPARSFHVSAVDLELLVWHAGSHGNVSVEIGSAPTDEGAAVLEGPEEPRPALAIWPSAADCADGWAALSRDSTLSGESAADVIATLAEQPPEELRWSDGSAAELRLSFEALPDELCQSTGDVLEFDASLRARSSDGRVDSVVPVRVVADRDEIQITRASDTATEGAPAPAPPGNDGTPAHVDIEARYRRDGASGSLQVHAAASEETGARRAQSGSGDWSR